MLKRYLMSHLLVLGLVTSFPVCAQGSTSLTVTGDLVEEKIFHIDQLRQLPQKEIAESRDFERDGIQETRRIVYRGVLLRDLILASGFKEGDRFDFRRTFFIAKATDGYIALFTWGELFNADAGNNVLVITASNGEPLPASEGPLALRSLSDVRPGPRHVRWLEEVKAIRIK